ncbi:uncharacterized protein LACBIDRAFT_324314 [Laccaria bicolor S238N-H82]|uniref:Predicted protein n=1 Tax=Laccaria bicolor (strain S238N-H82 / ATCC MYA-4686) TaxID=486041 RepID=B0D1F0_LACBS|nr:uncharacterized protein LACBIDRAFT_324314 [Laccaria bicolor S238N-H82]EDR11986.1 predicted protein [Laccaria bicolor S238N-H82]|eukprot:XP_001877883.1 predicted protein [Laccaria bicolor S238N-H82]
MPYLANRHPDCSRLFCAGKPSFTPFFGPPELAKRSRIGYASPSSAWYGQNEHISSVLGEILVVPFVLWLVLNPRSTRFWEAFIRVKRTSGSRVTAPSLQQPLTCDLFMSYLANRRPDRAHLFCVRKPSFTPFFGLPELAKRSSIGGASPSSAWYDQDEHISSVLGEIFVVPFALCFWVSPLYLDNHGSSRYANYTVGKASFVAFERVFDLQERARNHYAMLKHIFGYLRISPLFGVLRLDWRTLMGRGDTSTG